MLSSIISTYFWWLWLLAPARGFWILWKNILAPYIFQPAPVATETDEKKQKKLERKMRRHWWLRFHVYVPYCKKICILYIVAVVNLFKIIITIVTSYLCWLIIITRFPYQWIHNELIYEGIKKLKSDASTKQFSLLVRNREVSISSSNVVV